ncbi:hypothetical protein D3C76_1554450 [compost metagenome]
MGVLHFQQHLQHLHHVSRVIHQQHFLAKQAPGFSRVPGVISRSLMGVAQRQADGESATAANAFGTYIHRASMGFNQLPHQRQANA